MYKIIDLSHELNKDIKPYPGDKTLNIIKDKDYNKDGYTIYQITTNMHQGTHIDSMMHLSSNKQYINAYDLNYFYGKANILDFKDKLIIDWDDAYDDTIEESILLIYTGFDRYMHEDIYYKKHPILTDKFVSRIIKKGVKTIGIDFASPDYEPYLIHQKLFLNNIFIIENLTHLDQLIKIKNFTFSALPLNIKAEASLVRAVAIINE